MTTTSLTIEKIAKGGASVAKQTETHSCSSMRSHSFAVAEHQAAANLESMSDMTEHQGGPGLVMSATSDHASLVTSLPARTATEMPSEFIVNSVSRWFHSCLWTQHCTC